MMYWPIRFSREALSRYELEVEAVDDDMVLDTQ